MCDCHAIELLHCFKRVTLQSGINPQFACFSKWPLTTWKRKIQCPLQSVNTFWTHWHWACLLGTEREAKWLTYRSYFFPLVHTPTPGKAAAFWRDGSLQSLSSSLISWCIPWDRLPKQHTKVSPYIIVTYIFLLLVLFVFLLKRRPGKWLPNVLNWQQFLSIYTWKHVEWTGWRESGGQAHGASREHGLHANGRNYKKSGLLNLSLNVLLKGSLTDS